MARKCYRTLSRENKNNGSNVCDSGTLIRIFYRTVPENFKNSLIVNIKIACSRELHHLRFLN